MKKAFSDIINGYQNFREKYTKGDQSIMQFLSVYGQAPRAMVVACCDSRVDPALILQCDPGDLFVVRNVANIVPPYEKDNMHHGTSAALEFGIRFLNIKHLILLGHSQCGGIQALLEGDDGSNDFISSWVSLITSPDIKTRNADDYARRALQSSYQNCLSFPWIQEKVAEQKLIIHRWFFDIKSGQIFTYSDDKKAFTPLDIDFDTCYPQMRGDPSD